MTIKLEEKRQIVVVPAQVVTTDEILINEIRDTGTSVIAMITPLEKSTILAQTRTIVLWEGKEYEQIGQWTDSDVENKLKQIL